MPKERPILFSSPMVRAILDGRKTQTRRIISQKRHSLDDLSHPECTKILACDGGIVFTWGGGSGSIPIVCPYGKPGDRLWVRETWADTNYEGGPAISYRADGDRLDLMERQDFLCRDGSFNYDDHRVKKLHFMIWCHDLEGGVEKGWKPSIHMPRWASRIDLLITSVRVERLQDISEADAKAEGAEPLTLSDGGFEKLNGSDYQGGFKRLWQAINGAESWETNSFVWCIEFERVKP